MLSRFSWIYDELRQFAENEEKTIAMNLMTLFKSKITNFCSMPAQIDQVTKYLQTEHLSLSNCRLALETITESVEKEGDDSQPDLYQCKLGKHYSSRNSPLITNGASKVDS